MLTDTQHHRGPGQPATGPTVYRIRLAGHLDGSWSDWFDGISVSTRGAETILVGALPDQPALYGLLRRVRDLGLTLLAVERVDPPVGRLGWRRYGLKLPGAGDLLRRALAVNRWLTLFGLLAMALFVAMFGLSFIDPRLVTGAPVWHKPMKFALSLTINAFTLLWLLHFVRGRRRWVSLAANLTAVASLVELAIIALQAARGVGSHFNVATPLDSALFSTMGIFVFGLWAGILITAVLLLFQRFPDPIFAWTLRLGIFITFAGAGLGGFMLGPTADQMAEARATGIMDVIGAHAVGVPDGGAGLPFLGWSTEGGDLRAAHFFGLHGIQVMALVGGLLTLLGPAWLGRRQRLMLVWTAGLGYATLVGLLLWQALRAEPVVAPGPTTLASLAGLTGAVALAVAGALVWARRADREA